jgi:chromate transporter
LIIKRHIPFLKTVFLHSLTAFGGPQMHLIRMQKLFVSKTPYITNQELGDYNAFVQLLPGASSSQTVTLIGLKRGGWLLACLTLLIWMLPACILMTLLSYLLQYIDSKDLSSHIFKYVQPMALGFLLYSAIKSFKLFISHQATFFIMLGAFLVTAFINSPWVFPALIIVGGFISNFSNKRIPEPTDKPKPINWNNLWLFAFIFLLAGVLSEVARAYNWEMRKPISLFENFYRFGSLVFGGGYVLIPMIFEQYVIRSKTAYLTSGEFLTGTGMVQAFPGPTFSIAAFVGGMVLRHMGPQYQLLGSIIASIAIFLPSLLLVFFFFPIWNKLKKYVVIIRAIEGINAVVVGIIFGSLILFFTKTHIMEDWHNYLIILGTYLILMHTKISPPFVVMICVALGFIF